MLNEWKTKCIQSDDGMWSKPGVDEARSSLRSKRSVITPLWIHSGFYIPAPEKLLRVHSI